MELQDIKNIAYATVGLLLILSVFITWYYRKDKDIDYTKKPVIKGDDFGGSWNLNDDDFNKN